MEESRVGVSALAESLGLSQITGNQDAIQRWIITPDVNRPGLELAGYVLESEKKRVVILGNKELTYIDTLSPEIARERFDSITDGYTPCIIISSNRHCPDLLKEIAIEKNFPIFSSMKNSSSLMVDIIGFLEKSLAPNVQLHGCLVSIYGRGVIISGPSGIGKSEITLELVRKGHIMIADDVVIVSRIQNQLIGRAPEILYGMLEIRGIGIIDCVKMFGAAAVMPESNVDYFVELQEWKHDNPIERDYLDEPLCQPILEVSIDKIRIPVSSGRSLSTIIETAVINKNLKKMGIDVNKEFDQKIIDFISEKGD